MFLDIQQNLQNVKKQITEAAQRAGRDPNGITLVAVSKGKPVSMIHQVLEAEHKDIGENYAQEFNGKWIECKTLPVRWHFVGHIQRRKVRDIVGKVELIHSLDSLQLALEISKEASKRKIIQKCLLQINLAGEKTKSGIPSSQAASLLSEISSLNNLEVTGLMTMPPLFEKAERSRPFFRLMSDLKTLLNAKKVYRSELKELSMGMTNDFPIAIKEGATIIRVGTAIFGERIIT